MTRPDLPDLTMYLAAHDGMRRSVWRLARTFDEAGVGRPSLPVEDHLTITLKILRHHQRIEDEVIWPRLRRLAPEIEPSLARLEADHAAIDPLLETAADTGNGTPERAKALRRLHAVLDPHLSGEEADVVPVIKNTLTHEQWAEIEKITQMRSTITRDEMPLAIGWTLSTMTKAELKSKIPAPWRLMWHLRWKRAWRRHERLAFGIG